MSQTIRIGTRESQLALWQAHLVKNKLEALGYSTEIIPVTSKGDQELTMPLYEMGIIGIFTKALDIALLHNEIDIAVHSMKDVPTKSPQNIRQVAVLERAHVYDILVYKNLDFLDHKGTIATGSLRRKAQWLHKYPQHQVVNLRGNVNTRLQKLKDNHWDGAIFAYAGLDRINLLPQNHQVLDWMIPAPAQGAITVHAREDNDFAVEAVAKINHQNSEICTSIERQFLSTLEGGCTAPIGAYAQCIGDTISFTGGLFSLNGKQKIVETASFSVKEHHHKGQELAEKILLQGGKKMMEEIRSATSSNS